MAYILQVSGGQYDAAYTSNVAVSRNLRKIELLKTELERKRDLIVDIYNKTSKHSREWDEANPFDHEAQEQTLAVPKWPAGLDQRLITQDMRDERNTIKNINEGICVRNSARSQAWVDRYHEAELAHARELGLFDVFPESELQYYHSVTSAISKFSSMFYSIEIIEEIT